MIHISMNSVPRYIKSDTTPDVVYVPMNWLLRFYVPWYVKSHATHDVVYVPINSSLRFWIQNLIRLLTFDEITITIL